MMHKQIIRLGMFGGVATLALATIIVDQVGAKRSAAVLAAERDSARRAGIALFVPELAKSMPPASENAAVVYANMPRYNAESPQNKAEDDLYSRLIKSPTTLSAADWQAIRKTVANEAPRLRAIHDAASKPDCVFPHDYQTPHPETILLPEFAQIRNAARLLSMESLLMAHDGDGAAAAKNAAHGFRLADHAYSDSLLIGYLVAVAIDNITANTMQKILLLDPSAMTANAVLAALKNSSPRSVKPALGSESAFEQTMCETIRREGFRSVQKMASAAGEEQEQAPMTPFLAANFALRRTYWNQTIDRNATTMLRLNRAAMMVCDAPYRESQPALTRIMSELSYSRNPEYFLAAILLPVEAGLPRTRALTTNKMGVTQAAAAVVAYRAAHGGALPATLSEAMPAPPTNAFDDSPLQYTRTPGGFLLEALDPSDPTSKSSRMAFTFPAAR